MILRLPRRSTRGRAVGHGSARPDRDAIRNRIKRILVPAWSTTRGSHWSPSAFASRSCRERGCVRAVAAASSRADSSSATLQSDWPKKLAPSESIPPKAKRTSREEEGVVSGSPMAGQAFELGGSWKPPRSSVAMRMRQHSSEHFKRSFRQSARHHGDSLRDLRRACLRAPLDSAACLSLIFGLAAVNFFPISSR
jgi:hypothetical protein